MTFKYKIGDLETSVPWDRPSKEKLQKWYQDFIQIPGVENYEFWVGSSLFNVEDTWDVDIIIIGEIKDYYILKNILDKSIELGFKHKQLIDMFHSNQLWYFDQPYKATTKIRNWESWKKYIDKNIIDLKIISNSEKIIPGLYKKTYTSPARSYLWGVEKFKKGEYNLDYRTLFNILDKE